MPVKLGGMNPAQDPREHHLDMTIPRVSQLFTASESTPWWLSSPTIWTGLWTRNSQVGPLGSRKVPGSWGTGSWGVDLNLRQTEPCHVTLGGSLILSRLQVSYFSYPVHTIGQAKGEYEAAA
jgi:hypothetical protein